MSQGSAKIRIMNANRKTIDRNLEVGDIDHQSYIFPFIVRIDLLTPGVFKVYFAEFTPDRYSLVFKLEQNGKISPYNDEPIGRCSERMQNKGYVEEGFADAFIDVAKECLSNPQVMEALGLKEKPYDGFEKNQEIDANEEFDDFEHIEKPTYSSEALGEDSDSSSGEEM